MTYESELRRFKETFWKKKLRQCKGNVQRAAREGGINRTYLHKLMHDLGIPKGYAKPLRPHHQRGTDPWRRTGARHLSSMPGGSEPLR